MKRAVPGWLLLALAGLAAVFGAFLPFYTYANGVAVTVWSRGLFPTAALIPLLGVAVGLEAVFVLVRRHEPRSPFLNFTWEQARLAVGAFMILLTLSYLLQDRAGGTLGLGYALLAGSSLATFGGGILTRRAQLARAPGEEALEPEHRPVIKPALANVSRASSDLVKNISDRGHNMRVRLAERHEARAAARKEAAEQAAARPAEAEQTTAEKTAAEHAAAEPAAAEKTVEEPAHPAPPTTTVETLPAEPHPPAATLDELPAEAPAEHPPPAATVDAPETEPAPAADEPEHATDTGATEPSEAAAPTETAEALDVSAATAEEPEDTAEIPVVDAVSDEKSVDAPPVAKLGAVPSDAEPDATPPPDGKNAPEPDDATAEHAPATEDAKEKEKEKESADSSTES